MRETNAVSGIRSLVLISTTFSLCWDCKTNWSPTYLIIHCVLELYPVCQVFFPSNYSIISADYFNQMIIWLIGIKMMSSTPSRLRWPSISYRITDMLSFNGIWLSFKLPAQPNNLCLQSVPLLFPLPFLHMRCCYKLGVTLASNFHIAHIIFNMISQRLRGMFISHIALAFTSMLLVCLKHSVAAFSLNKPLFSAESEHQNSSHCEELVPEGGKQCTYLDCWCSKFELCSLNAFIAKQINTSDQYNRCCSSVGPIDRHRMWSYAHTLSHSQ